MHVKALIEPLKYLSLKNNRLFSLAVSVAKEECPSYMEVSDELKNEEKFLKQLLDGVMVKKDFLSESEENSILDEIEPHLKTLRYEFDHWDDAIHGYRETERMNWNINNGFILNRIKKEAFLSNVNLLRHVHILDLNEKGFIKPHIDATRFCGNTIAGLSLLSDSVMKLVNEKNKELHVKIHLFRRSLYILKDTARYDYTHEILKNEESIFKNCNVIKNRRISVIIRNEPVKKDCDNNKIS